MIKLTDLEIYGTMVAGGFPLVVATTMTAIAQRESSGVPSAFNGNEATGDRSYGLLQINMRDSNVAKLINAKVLKGQPETALLDPLLNAQAGCLLWGGANSNLDVAWYITREGYRQAYEKHLPAAQAAALQYRPVKVEEKKK